MNISLCALRNGAVLLVYLQRPYTAAFGAIRKRQMLSVLQDSVSVR